MPNPEIESESENNECSQQEFDLYLEERKLLIDAAREAARTFDQAVLAFGTAAFAGSITFLKDVAPRPEAYSLKWLAISWALFSLGLLGVMLSFLFSHRACMVEIEVGGDALGKQGYKRKPNRYSLLTTLANYLCIGFLFLGLLSWSVFAFENLTLQGRTMSNPKPPTPPVTDTLKKGFAPAPQPPKAPKPIPATPPPTPPAPKK